MENEEKVTPVYDVRVTRNWYFVPFEFKEEFDFAATCKKIDEKSYDDQYKWVRSQIRAENQGDNEDEDDDLFQYIVDEFSMMSDENAADKLGCHWIFQKENEDSILKFQFQEDESSYIQVDIAQMGMYIFRTGIGLLWYEAALQPDNDKPLTNKRLEKFQHIFNKLNDVVHIRMWMDNCLSLNSTSDKVNELLQSTARACGDSSTISAFPDERLPFSLGNWVAERLSFLQVDYFFQRKNHYPEDLMAYYERSRHSCIIPAELSYKAAKKCDKRDALVKGYLGDVGNKVSESKFNEQFPSMCPNKSIIFSYTFFNSDNVSDSDNKRARIVYNLTNGYDSKFNFSDNIMSSMIKPFKNVILYATREGGGYYAFEKPGAYFYEEVASRKVKANYFVLYVKALYQSYSLLHFTHLLAGDKISADYRDFMAIEDDENIDKKLRKDLSRIRSMINVFLLKSTVTSIGHVQHLNEFYNYLEKQLFIHEDIASVSAGLDVMDELVKEQLEKDEEKREARKYHDLQNILSIVAFLTLASTVSDSHAFITELLGGKVLFGENLVFTIVILVLVAWGIGLYWRNRNK